MAILSTVPHTDHVVKPLDQNSLNQKVGFLIRQLREAKGISQEDLADLAGLDRTYISGIERFKRNITIRTLSKIIPFIAESEDDFFRKLVKVLGNG